MHIDMQFVIAISVGSHLLATLAKALWHSPRQQAQVDAIEQKVDDILGALKVGQ